ncbi:ATP-binding cassette domain-containing protein [Candidatus Sumerlaeota bacterium]|nr:ATP-binding cassette domain-containing protein [Candidatus Sumerlaeota bacterium]
MNGVKIKAEQISKRKVLIDRNSSTRREIEVLRDISFEVKEKSCFAVIGPSGAGKSTLLRMLNRLEDPTTGRILLDGQDITRMNVIEVRRRVGFVSQTPVVFSGTVEDNLLLPLRLHKRVVKNVGQKIRTLCEVVGLENDLLSRNAEQLSVGQKQRMAIVRSLMLEPEVILLDEPTANLDSISAYNFLGKVKDVNRHLGLTIIIVTHQMRYVKLLADEVMVIKDGCAVEQGTVEQIFTSPSHPITRLLLEEGMKSSE